MTQNIAEARRRLALDRMDRAATFYGVESRDWRVLDRGGDAVLLGKSTDGREFGIAYLKETEAERQALS